MLLLHLPQLGDGAMDTFEAGLQQHAQGAGATALLEGFAAAIEAGDLPLQLGLLLLQAAAGALLQGQGCRQLLEPGLLPGQVYFQLLPFPFGQLRLLGGAATGICFSGLLGAEFQLALAVLAQPFQQLLQFGLQRRQALAELLALLAALALLLQPAAAAVGHLPQAPAGEVDGRFCIAAGGLGGLQGLFVVVGLEQLQLLAQLGLLAGQLLALTLQGFCIQLVLFRLAGQFPGPCLQTGQFGLHGQQLIFSEGLHLGLQLFEQGGGGGDFAFLHQQLRLALLLLLLEGLLALVELPQGQGGGLPGQQLFLQAACLEALAQLLVAAGLGAVALQFLARHQQLLAHDVAALLAFLHLAELAAALLDAGVEQGHPCQFIDDAAAIAGAHRDDAGDIALHDHVAALWIHPQAAQLTLQLLQIAGHPVGVEAAAVGAPRRHPQPPADGPAALAGLDPGTLLHLLQAQFGWIGLPVGQVKAHADHGFGGAALAEHGAIDQIGQPFGAHAAAGGQAQAEQHRIEDVALARAIGAGNHRKTGVERDRDRAAKRLEVGELDLIDVDQQAHSPVIRNVAEAAHRSREFLAWA